MKKETQNKWLNKYSLFFYFSIIQIIVIWFILDISRKMNIISAILFLVANALHNWMNQDKKTPFFIQFTNWFGFGIMAFFTFGYFLLSVGEIIWAILMLIGGIIAISVASLVMNFIGLFKVRTLIGIIISYTVISFMLVVLSGYLYTIASAYPGNGIIWAASGTTFTSWDYIYFSSSVYYSNALGDIFPLGMSKVIMQVESAFSFVFHIIILGAVISGWGKKKKFTT